MGFLNDLNEFLQKPFPVDESHWQYYQKILMVSLFITFFLYFFTPFDLSTLEDSLFINCLGFGLITFLACVVYDKLISPILRIKFKDEELTYGKWLIHMTGTILTISLGNFLFVRYSYFGYVDWQFFPHMIQGTFLIGIFPIMALGAIGMLRSESRYQDISDELNKNLTNKIKKSAKSKVEIFGINVDMIRYIEALQNYVRITFVNEGQELTEKIERASLKTVLNDLNDSSIVQCHRSYLVNEDHITETKGNAQGLRLSLSYCDKIIPVSRSFVSQFRK